MKSADAIRAEIAYQEGRVIEMRQAAARCGPTDPQREGRFIDAAAIAIAIAALKWVLTDDIKRGLVR